MNTRHLRGLRVRKIVKRGLRKLARETMRSMQRVGIVDAYELGGSNRAGKMITFALYRSEPWRRRILTDIDFIGPHKPEDN